MVDKIKMKKKRADEIKMSAKFSVFFQNVLNKISNDYQLYFK